MAGAHLMLITALPGLTLPQPECREPHFGNNNIAWFDRAVARSVDPVLENLLKKDKPCFNANPHREIESILQDKQHLRGSRRKRMR